MKKLKIATMLFCILSIMLLCSCVQVPQSYAQELTESDWSQELANGTKVSLTFYEDNKAAFDIKGDYDNTCTISGVCTVSEKAIVISDRSMAKNISMDYKLYGNKVELIYMGETISLDKQEDNTDNSKEKTISDENNNKTQESVETDSDSGS